MDFVADAVAVEYQQLVYPILAFNTARLLLKLAFFNVLLKEAIGTYKIHMRLITMGMVCHQCIVR